MSKIIDKSKYLFCFTLVLVIFLSTIDFFCFDKSFYHSEYSQIGVAENIGVSEEDLNLMTDDLLDYLRNNKEDLSLVVNVNGIDREAYNERETIHMADVKDLYQSVLLIRNISLIISIVLLILYCIKKSFNNIFLAYKKVLILFAIILIAIGIMCLIDFDSFWISFHEIFFTKNDYWLLNPATSLLINMVPSKFFFDLCIRIIVGILVILALLFFGFRYLDKRLNK